MGSLRQRGHRPCVWACCAATLLRRRGDLSVLRGTAEVDAGQVVRQAGTSRREDRREGKGYPSDAVRGTLPHSAPGTSLPVSPSVVPRAVDCVTPAHDRRA